MFPFLILQDSTRHWSLHAAAATDAEMAVIFRGAIAMDVPFEMLSVNEWTQHLLCAERYGDNRVFLAGDAAHLVIPTGGLGMNTGIGDATDLAWKLAGTLHGWDGPALLASYELERRQVGLRNVAAAGAAMSGRLGWRAAWRPDIREPSGDATRIEICRRFDTEQRKITEISGIECGYRYVGSPVIAPAQQLLRWHRRSPLSRVEPGKAPAQLGQYIAHQPAYLAQRMPGRNTRLRRYIRKQPTLIPEHTAHHVHLIV